MYPYSENDKTLLSPADRSRHPLLVSVLVPGILILAVLLRLYPVFIHPERERNGLRAFGGSFHYHLVASDLARGDGCFRAPDAGPPGLYSQGRERLSYGVDPRPGYPLFTAVIYKYFGLSASGHVSLSNISYLCIKNTRCV